jgi:hypothetical protein
MTDTLSLDQKSDATKAVPTHVLRIHNFRMLWIGGHLASGRQVLHDRVTMAGPHADGKRAGGWNSVRHGWHSARLVHAGWWSINGSLHPAPLMMNSNIARMILTGLLAALVMTDLIQLWMLYVLALLFGLADAFFFPTQTSIVPGHVRGDWAQSGSTALAGALIGLNTGILLIRTGSLMTIFTLSAAFSPAVRSGME